jgi:hypothetical protein
MISLESSKYPFGRLFKPKLVVVKTSKQLVKAVKDALNQTVHPTQDELDWCKRRNWPVSRKYYANDDFDSNDVASWKQEGIYWIRKIQGPNSHCWTNSQVGATVRWRNSPGSYCCAGLPYYETETLEKFSHTMELLKPLVRSKLGGKMITISLERTLRPPQGTCWGIKTGALYFRVAVGEFSKDNYGTRITKSWVALTQYLETLINPKFVPEPPKERNEFQNKDTQKVWENLHGHPGSFNHVGLQVAIAKDLKLKDKDWRGAIWGYKMPRQDELPPAQQMVLDGLRYIKIYIMEGVDDTKVKWLFLANKFWRKYQYQFSM